MYYQRHLFSPRTELRLRGPGIAVLCSTIKICDGKVNARMTKTNNISLSLVLSVFLLLTCSQEAMSADRRIVIKVPGIT